MATETHGNIGMKQETTFGTEASPPDVFEAILDESIQMQSEMIRPRSANGLMVSRFSTPGRITVGGGIDTVLAPEGVVPWMLKGIFGKLVTSEVATGVYDHAFSPAHSSKLPSFTIQTNLEEMCQYWMGCTFSDMSLTASPDQLPTLSMSLIGQRPGESPETTPATFSDANVFKRDRFAFALNGIENLEFQNFTLNIRNDIEVVYTMNQTRYCSKHHVRGLDISGSITLQFKSEIERRRLWGALNAIGPQNIIAPGSLVATATHTDEAAPGYPFAFTINIPELYYQSAPANITRSADKVTQRIYFKPSWNFGANEIITMTMRNRVPAYPDPE